MDCYEFNGAMGTTNSVCVHRCVLHLEQVSTAFFYWTHNLQLRLCSDEASTSTATSAMASRRRFRRKKKSSASESESSPPSPKYSTSTASTISLQDREDDEVPVPTGGSLPASPQPMAMWGPRRKISDSLLVPSPHGLSRSLRAQNSCPETPGPSSGPAAAGPSPVSPVGSRLLAAHALMSHGGHQGLLTSASLHSPPTSLLLHQPAAAAAVAAAAAHISPAKACLCHAESIEAMHHQLAQSEEVQSLSVCPSRLSRGIQFLTDYHHFIPIHQRCHLEKRHSMSPWWTACLFYQ